MAATHATPAEAADKTDVFGFSKTVFKRVGAAILLAVRLHSRASSTLLLLLCLIAAAVRPKINLLWCAVHGVSHFFLPRPTPPACALRESCHE